ncbi:hypothetical protein [Cesiribacter sp. SM1]|uniref:hypothetical protein n=1 Tax=Cesiribacter sp. SM1 TaxID=2861196 RepID=UPI001CD4BC71|nr:hypothetical protein [Cesiribacter sp. SM1]
MKHTLLLTFAFLTLSIAANAQTEINTPQVKAPVAGEAISQGNWLLGANIGNLGFNFKSEMFQLGIEPKAGYFISDNAVIGVQTLLNLEVYDGGEAFHYGVTPFVRYYFPEGARASGRWFGEALIGFGGSSTEDSEEDAALSHVWGFKGGYAHFVGQNVALEGVLGYVRTNADFDTGHGITGLSVGFGFNIYLPAGNRTVTVGE